MTKKVKFLHVRMIDTDDNGDGWLCNDGGFTIAYTGDNVDTYKIAYSVCSDDKFRRAKGREIVLRRFEAGHIITKAFADSADNATKTLFGILTDYLDSKGVFVDLEAFYGWVRRDLIDGLQKTQPNKG